MSDNKIVGTRYGQFSRFDVTKKESLLSSPTFYVHKDGKPYRGSFSTLQGAVNAADEEANKRY
jgi:hypothetical protein